MKIYDGIITNLNPYKILNVSLRDILNKSSLALSVCFHTNGTFEELLDVPLKSF